MRPFLFVVGSTTAYRIHKPFAAFCASQGRKVAFVYDREPDALFQQLSRDAAAIGATAVSLDQQIGAGPHNSPWSLFNRPDARAKAFDNVRKQSTNPRMAAFANIIFGRLAAAQALIKSIKPAVVIVAEDGVAGPLAMITAAQRAGIAVTVLPYGYGTQQDFEIALDRKQAAGELETASGPEGEAIARHAAEWIKRGQYEGALLFPADYIVVLESAGIRVRNAWVVHGGMADRLFVESPQMMALYQSEGLPAEKLLLTGSPYGDFILESLAGDDAARAAFRRPVKISAGRTRVLGSWPPSYHSERGPQSEFATYSEMTHRVLSGLRDIPNVELTVSVHPAVSATDREAIEELGATVSDHYVLSLIPAHDLYVSYYSSTIRWAIASGKPVINYDAYKLNLDVYDAAPAVVTTPSADRVLATVAELANSDAAFTALAEKQVAVAPHWGLLEAPAMPRLLAELERLSR